MLFGPAGIESGDLGCLRGDESGLGQALLDLLPTRRKRLDLLAEVAFNLEPSVRMRALYLVPRPLEPERKRGAVDRSREEFGIVDFFV